MLGNGIKQTTATTGTGNLTLSSVSGFPTFANVFAVNQPFSYGLLDSSGQPIEYGIGYLSDATTLVRARVTATYSGGTYTQVSASAISLSGTTTVICTPNAASMEATQPTVDSNSASVGRFLTSAGRNMATSALILTNNRCVYTPFVLRTGTVISSLAANVTTNQASAIIKTGIYAMAANGYIGDRLATAADIDASTTGFKSASLSSSIFLPAGTYYTACVTSGSATAPSITCHGQTSASFIGGSPLGLSSSAITIIDSRYETLGAGASLPSTPNATTTAGTVGGINVPCVYMGVA